MSLYPFAPMLSMGIGESHYATWNDAFTSHELKRVKELGMERVPRKARVQGFDEHTDYQHVRSSNTSWIELNDQTQWLYHRLAHVANHVNSRHWRFDLYGFSEHFQFTQYESAHMGHYSWHVDRGVDHTSISPRKLSMVVQLSDPAEYEGGNLELLVGEHATLIPKQAGLIAFFPSYVLHRVTPVTSGTRYSLVGWITGPNFR